MWNSSHKMDVKVEEILVSEGQINCELEMRKNSGKSLFVALIVLNVNIRANKYLMNVTDGR